MLLTSELLPAIRSVAGDVFVFQQDNAPAHRAHIMTQASFCAVRHLSSSVTEFQQSVVVNAIDL